MGFPSIGAETHSLFTIKMLIQVKQLEVLKQLLIIRYEQIFINSSFQYLTKHRDNILSLTQYNTTVPYTD